MTTQAHVTAEI